MDKQVKQTLIRVEHVSKVFKMNKAVQKLLQQNISKDEIYKKTGATVALQDVSFEVNRGEIFCIIGLSGSGKSTIIRCLNELLKVTSGKIFVNDIDLTTISKKELLQFRRDQISMVFQNFGLMSHRDVMGNVEYGLEVKGINKDIRQAKAKEMIAMVGLEGLEHEKISSLSGGMKQRVGIARALSSKAEILLMDEPFSALDPLVRKEMQFELLKIQKKLNKTIVFITHDMDEAFKLGDRVAIMQDGNIVQIDTPEAMCENPANDYVKDFVENANKTKVFSAKHVMINPSCMIRQQDSAILALKEMNNNQVSSAYVVDENIHFIGIVLLDDALRARKEKLSLKEVIIRDVTTVDMDTSIADLMEAITASKYPLAVVDKQNQLQGILTKSSILSLLS